MIGRSEELEPGGSMRIRVFAAALIVLLAGPVYAQQTTPVPRYGEKDKDKTWNELEQEKEAERAYKRSLGNVPEKGPVDPWGNARNVGEPKAAAKADAKAADKTVTPKPKAKTGETAK
jgi:hypothetical protein